MIENLGAFVTIIALMIAAAAGIIAFYNTLVSHREVLMQNREALYYRLFDEQDEEDEYEDRNEPYYED